eukprot:TRINITY_DN8875_c0_g1_i4.p1 TRINITY_DN8875_c0_g1~~TRINITY_DN8875_c0_g1_i4.p1  ORF type:complete len:266 (-),score=0.77 TRINITY_DN8875_c0_g1_i4:83-880(-)
MTTTSDDSSKDETNHLAEFGVEMVSAVFAASLVAPFITIVDKSITSNASGRETLWKCMYNTFKTLLTKPKYFFTHPSFLLIWGVYSGTYIVANCIEMFCNWNSIPWFYPKFLGTSATNVTLSVLKDAKYARLFGRTDAPPRSIPMRSLGLFAARDSFTILASFNLPPILSEEMQKRGLEKSKADILAQLTTPCVAQFFSSPMHLLGLDLFNYPEKTSAERRSFVRREYLKTSIARVCRIFPAYGIGGVMNTLFRRSGHEFIYFDD